MPRENLQGTGTPGLSADSTTNEQKYVFQLVPVTWGHVMGQTPSLAEEASPPCPAPFPVVTVRDKHL